MPDELDTDELRNLTPFIASDGGLLIAAADEIDRLRQENALLRQEIDRRLAGESGAL